MKDPVVSHKGTKLFKVIRGYVETYPSIDTNPRWLYEWTSRYRMHSFRSVRNR